MSSWVCRADGTVFAVGAPCCPQCQARDAHEQGGSDQINVYDAVETTGITDPGAAWGAVNERLAETVHDARRVGVIAPPMEELRVQMLQSGGDVEVAERLGDVDATYREPSPAPAEDDETELATADTPAEQDEDTSDTRREDVPS